MDIRILTQDNVLENMPEPLVNVINKFIAKCDDDEKMIVAMHIGQLMEVQNLKSLMSSKVAQSPRDFLELHKFIAFTLKELDKIVARRRKNRKGHLGHEAELINIEDVIASKVQ